MDDVFILGISCYLGPIIHGWNWFWRIVCTWTSIWQSSVLLVYSWIPFSIMNVIWHLCFRSVQISVLFSENSQICRAFSIRNSFLIPPSWFSTHFLSHPHDFLLMLAIRNYCTDIQNMHLATYSALFKAAALFKAVWFPHWYSILLPI